jgi:hypothetical protein
LRWVLKDIAGIVLALPAGKTLGLEGRLVKDGVWRATSDRQNALTEPGLDDLEIDIKKKMAQETAKRVWY